MKILVLGGCGMAGHMIYTYLNDCNDEAGNKKYAVNATFIHEKAYIKGIKIDIEHDLRILFAHIDSEKYDAVINCIGLLVSDCQSHPSRAAYINGLFPHLLSRHLKSSQTRLIHLSTDCVFNGKLGEYRENFIPNEDSNYGFTKSCGEKLNFDKDLVLRLSIIGPELKLSGTGLFHWFMNQTGKIFGYSKVYWNGITTLQLAEHLDEILGRPQITGIYHLCPDFCITKYRLLQLFKEIWKRDDINIEENHTTVCDKTLVDTREQLMTVIPTYDAMIYKMRDWMLLHKQLYSDNGIHYKT